MARRVQSPILVGRTSELASIAEAVRRLADAGEGATVLVTGEAGIGKSRFVREVAGLAAAEGVVVLTGACDEFGPAARPFGIVQQLTPGLLRALSESAPAASAEASRGTLGAMVAGMEAASESGQLSRLFVASLVQLCAAVPVMIVVDDLHWSDESSRVFFRELASVTTSHACFVVGAYREDEIERGHPLRAVLAAMHREARPEVLHMRPFGAEETRQLAAAIGLDLAESEIHRCQARSAGNVFLLEELFSVPEGSFPPGASDVLMSRLDRLPAAASLVAEAAALDTALPRGALLAATQLPAEEFDLAFDALVSSGLLVCSSDRFGYRHALFREIAYQAIPESRRPVLHHRLAGWLEATPGTTAAEVARHWRHTDRKDRALTTTIMAAREALNAGAIPESADLFDIAFLLYEVRAPTAGGDGTGLEGVTLLWAPNGAEWRATPSVAATALNAVRAYQMCRRFHRAIEVLEHILDGPFHISAGERAHLLLRLSLMCWQNAGHEERDLPRVRPLLESAIACLDSSVPDGVRVEVLAHYVATRASWFGVDSRVLAALQEAERHVSEDMAPHALLGLRLAQAVTAVCQGDVAAFEELVPKSHDLRWQWASLPDLLVGLLSATGQHE